MSDHALSLILPGPRASAFRTLACFGLQMCGPAVLWVATARVAWSQSDVVTISDKVSCENCRLLLGPHVALADGNGAPSLAGPPSSILTNNRGQFVAAFGRREPPAVYDARGKFVRSVGRAGEGPGEYRSAEILLLVEGDSVLVIDRSLQRVTVLSPDWRYVRSAPIPDGTLSAAWTREERLVLAAQVNDAARFGKPFHVLDGVGNYLSSFGESDGTVIPGSTPPLSRRVCPAARGGFWSVPITGGYLIEQWTVDGTRTALFRRAADWFPTTGSPRLGFTPSDPPSPQILSIVEDQNGILWVAIRVADRNWKSAVRWDERRVGEQAARPMIEDRSKAFDVIVEAIDVREGKLLLRDRLDEAWAVFVDQQRLLSVREQSDGGIEVRIQPFSMRLSRDGRQ